jgi:hypothetical protein
VDIINNTILVDICHFTVLNRGMALTKGDKIWIKDLIEVQEEHFEAKIVEVKSDFYNKIDPILKEVVANQEERTLLSHKVSDHEDRIENIEKKLDIQPAI